MQPTINADCTSDHDQTYSTSRVLVRKWGKNEFRERIKKSRDEKYLDVAGYFGRGDIVLYNTPHDPHKVAIKRVVGIAGDCVTPLDGYIDGTESVVIPWSHLWVEGDVNDRKRSVDSNYFGPLSTQLIRGKALFVWSPWWNIFSARRLRADRDDWPARKQQRVHKLAVRDESVNPDMLNKSFSQFYGERGQRVLHVLQQQPESMETAFAENEEYRQSMGTAWAQVLSLARSHQDVDIREQARSIVHEMEKLFGRNALRESNIQKFSKSIGRGKRRVEPDSDTSEDATRHFENAIAHEEERAAKRQIAERPAKAAMEEMQKQKQQYAEMIDKEFLDREKTRGL